MQRDAASHARKASHANGFDLTGPEKEKSRWQAHTKGMQQHDDISFWMRDGVLDADLSRSSFVLVSNGFSM